MNTRVKITALWIITVICFTLHGHYHLSEQIYGIDIKSPRATGAVPLMAHIIRIVFESALLLMAILTMYVSSRIFKIVSLVVSGILILLNGFHFVSTILHEPGDFSQHAILIVILAANIALLVEFRRWLKEDSMR